MTAINYELVYDTHLHHVLRPPTRQTKSAHVNRDLRTFGVDGSEEITYDDMSVHTAPSALVKL